MLLKAANAWNLVSRIHDLHIVNAISLLGCKPEVRELDGSSGARQCSMSGLGPFRPHRWFDCPGSFWGLLPRPLLGGAAGYDPFATVGATQRYVRSWVNSGSGWIAPEALIQLETCAEILLPSRRDSVPISSSSEPRQAVKR